MLRCRGTVNGGSFHSPSSHLCLTLQGLREHTGPSMNEAVRRPEYFLRSRRFFRPCSRRWAPYPTVYFWNPVFVLPRRRCLSLEAFSVSQAKELLFHSYGPRPSQLHLVSRAPNGARSAILPPLFMPSASSTIVTLNDTTAVNVANSLHSSDSSVTPQQQSGW